MKMLLLLVCVMASACLTRAQTSTSKTSLQTMVDTERAFSQASHDKGTRDAFLAFIADDGILFRPTAVKGKSWMLANPLPASPTRGLLSWQPEFADVSQAGDMGFTFGPWQFKQDIKDAKPIRFGHFITVWRKQADGSWKFAVDLGISHPQDAGTATWQPSEQLHQSPSTASGAMDSWRNALLALEQEFSAASAKLGAVKALNSHASEDVRLFREGSLPFVGMGAADQAQPVSKGVWTWVPEAAQVSGTDDLGYTYGVYQIKRNDVITEKGNYLRIWKKQSGKWKVVVDVANPL